MQSGEVVQGVAFSASAKSRCQMLLGWGVPMLSIKDLAFRYSLITCKPEDFFGGVVEACSTPRLSAKCRILYRSGQLKLRTRANNATAQAKLCAEINAEGSKECFSSNAQL